MWFSPTWGAVGIIAILRPCSHVDLDIFCPVYIGENASVSVPVHIHGVLFRSLLPICFLWRFPQKEMGALLLSNLLRFLIWIWLCFKWFMPELIRWNYLGRKGWWNMALFQVTESTCNTKSLPARFMFSDGGWGVGDGGLMHRNAARWKVLSTQRKHLRWWGICREGYEGGGCFSSVGECVERDTLVVKALTRDGLEVVRSKPWELGGKTLSRVPAPHVEFTQRGKGKLIFFVQTEDKMLLCFCWHVLLSRSASFLGWGLSYLPVEDLEECSKAVVSTCFNNTPHQ